MDKVKLIHLFSGIGAPEIALKRLGIPIEIVGYSEIDKFAIQSYKAIHGEDIPNLGDIKKIKRLPRCNILFYGFCCQDISCGGKQKGLLDEDGNQTRSGLLFEVERLIHTAKNNNELPEILIMENVKNLVGKKFKPDFDRWLNELDNIGYNNYWQVLNAKDYGIPQNRERVFIVSIRKDINKRSYAFPEKMPLTKRLKDVLEYEVDKKYYLPQNKVQKLIKALENKDISNTIRAGSRSSLDRHTLDTIEYKPKIQQVEGNLYPNSGNPQAGRVYKTEGISPTLDTCQGGNRMPKIIEDIRIRRLTPLECWRLMGISDNDFIKAQASGVSNTQLYKQAGNSIVVDVLCYIFRNLFEIY